MCKRSVTLQGHKSASAGWRTAARQNKAPLWPAGPPFSWKANRGLSLWKMVLTGRQLCVLAMLVHRAQTSPLHWSPKVLWVSLTNLGSSLGFSVSKAACACIYWLLCTWDLRQEQDGQKRNLSLRQEHDFLSCCIGSTWCFQVRRQMI